MCGLESAIADHLVHFAEPSGLGLGFRFVSLDEGLITKYQIPEFIKGEMGRFAPFIPLSRADRAYGLAHIVYDGIFEYGEVSGEVSLELGSPDIDDEMSVVIYWDEDPICRLRLGRSAYATLFEDEPRILKPSEIRWTVMEWTLSEVEICDGADEDFAVNLCARVMATDMLQCATWCGIAPRPAIIEDIDMMIECHDDKRGIGERIAFETAEIVDGTVESCREWEDEDEFSYKGKEWSLRELAMKIQSVQVEI